MHVVRVALYGSVAVLQFHCDRTMGRKSWEWITDNCDLEPFWCCGQMVDPEPMSIVRISDGDRKRGFPHKKLRQTILASQDNRCLYCDRRFGTDYIRKGKIAKVLLAWDHRVPFAYSGDNGSKNWAASCYRCNAWKSDHIFKSVNEVRDYVARKWQAERARDQDLRAMRAEVRDETALAEVLPTAVSSGGVGADEPAGEDAA